VVAVVLLWFFLKKRKPKEKLPKPTKLRITTDLNEILADGKSTSKITVELLDKDGNPVAALADTEIKITVTGGKLEKPVVKIPRGKESEKTLLRASKESGTVSLSADAEGLERYCMHCGAKMTFAAKRCPECDKTPPAGVDTKLCKNCNAVIPVVAKFCAECGANQPKE
jgi:ribosomal protein L40E